jgi:hypothetical protein
MSRWLERYGAGGTPGWQREPELVEEWALPAERPPQWLLDPAAELLPV